MGVDTKGLLKGKVKHEEILNFIKQKYDEDAISCVGKNSYDERYMGFIYFKMNNEGRSMFYVSESGDKYDEVEQGKYTSISLGHDDNAIKIIREIVTEFEGYIEENDCDDKGFEPIIKNSDGTIKPVIRVTMEEIYEKFGGVVIIED